MGKVKEVLDDIYYTMTLLEPLDIYVDTFKVLEASKKATIPEQIMAVASALLVLLDKYQLDYSQVLQEAHRVTFSGDFNNMTRLFKKLDNSISKTIHIEV